MNGSARRVLVYLVLVWLGAAAGLAAAPPGPDPVSPGAAERFAGVGSPCPTFSWTAVDGARGYDIVVYPAATDEVMRGGPVEPLIHHRIDGQATTWTPPAGNCLAVAGSYAWSVRALASGGAGAWSESALFRVDLEPSLRVIAAAVERALGGYLESRGVAFEPDGAFAAELARELAEQPAPGTGTAPEAAAPEGNGGGTRYSRGRTLDPGDPGTRFVSGADEVELWLEESGSTQADLLQLVLATPDFDGDPMFGDAWSLGVVAETGLSVTGNLFLSSPGGTDLFQAEPQGVGFDPPIFRVPNLELSDIVRLIPKTVGSRPICGAAVANDEGRLYYDSGGDDLCYCDGTTWKKVDGDGAC